MRHLVILAATTLLVSATPLAAQQRVSADLRIAVATPTEKLSGADLDPGMGLGATIAVRLQPHLHVYGGWDWMRFRADHSFAGAKMDFEETGYTLGLRFEHPIRETSRFSYRVEAGATYKHIEVENEDGDIIADSDHGAGFEAGAGLLTPLAGSFKLTTMLRYRSLARDFTVANTTSSGSLRYGALEIGITRRF